MLMDTTTVLEIIKMIGTRIKNINNSLDEDEDQYDPANIRIHGKLSALKELGDHLQSFIENEVNKAEQ